MRYKVMRYCQTLLSTHVKDDFSLEAIVTIGYQMFSCLYICPFYGTDGFLKAHTKLFQSNSM